jgi:4-hydroxy-2-oxoheptanedioate aldolase
MRPNLLRQHWKDGKSADNCWLTIPSAFSAEIIAHQGWTSLTIDMQHGAIDYSSMCAMLTAIATTQCVPLVRVAWNAPGDVMRALDFGAYGIICPNVDTPEEAAKFAGACRYAPRGYRSVGPRRAALQWGADYMNSANDEILSIVQIETAHGLANVDQIAATQGIDMLYVGPSDLGLSLGREARPDQTDPVVVEAIDAILAAAKRARIRAGIFCRSPDYGARMMKKGFDLVTVASDDALLSAGAGIRAQFS